MIQHVLMGCTIAANRMDYPDGSHGFVIAIEEKGTGNSWNFPCDEATGKVLGGQLLGLGQVELQGADALGRLNGHEKKR